MIDRRGVLGTIGVGGAGAMATSSDQTRVSASNVAHPARTVSVRDFGAVGDGETDDTAAFNRACRAADPWSEALCYAIHVPSGRYRLDGTVYVRKGQTFFGDGHASYIDARRATSSTFVLGRRASGAHGVPDPGGAPVRLSDFHAMGGAPAHGFVETDAQGFSIANLFLTAVGIGIEISGRENTIASDGIVSDVFIDQCLQGILIGKAQNINLGSINIYRPKFAITIGNGAHDIIMSALSVAYTERAGITFSGEHIANIVVADSMFVSNGQYEEFISNILVRIVQGDVLFSGCTFRNWPRSCVVQDKPGGVNVGFYGCTFDGNQSSKLYDWSRLSNVLSCSSDGQFSFQGCAFRGVRGAIASLPQGKARLTIAGGTVDSGDTHRLAVDHRFAGSISIRNVSGFAPLEAADQQVRTNLPIWHGAGPWKIAVRIADPKPFVQEAVIHVDGDNVVPLAGWRTADDRQMHFAIQKTDRGYFLQAALVTERPETAVFSAETVN